MSHGSHAKKQRAKRKFHKSGRNAGDHIKKSVVKINRRRWKKEQKRAARKARRI